MNQTIPKGDAEFDAFAAPLMTWVLASMAALGLDQAFFNDEATPAWHAWQKAYKHWLDKTKRSHEITVAKNAARAVFEPILRKVVIMLRGCPQVTVAQLETLNIAVATRGPHSPVPVDFVDLFFNKQVPRQLGVTSRVHGSETKAKPKGVEAVEYRYDIGVPRVESIDDLRFTGMVTKLQTPFLIKVTEESLRNAEVQVSARLVNTLGQPGPWSEIYVVRIP